MYKYLLINSYFNMFFSISLTIKFTIRHLEENNIQFSKFNQTVCSQYIIVIAGKICSNIFRTGSNITYLSFTLSRYITITDKKNSFLVKFQKMNIKVFLLICLTVSIIINVRIFFQYKIKLSYENSELFHPFSAKKFSNYYKTEPIDDYKENFSSKSEYLLLNIANYVRIIFSDLAHIVSTTVIDIILFVFVKKK